MNSDLRMMQTTFKKLVINRSRLTRRFLIRWMFVTIASTKPSISLLKGMIARETKPLRMLLPTSKVESQRSKPYSNFPLRQYQTLNLR